MSLRVRKLKVPFVPNVLCKGLRRAIAPAPSLNHNLLICGKRIIDDLMAGRPALPDRITPRP